MSTPTLDDLFALPTQDEAFDNEVMPELVVRKVRVTDWIKGGVYRAMAYAVALLRVDVRKVIAALAAAGFEDYAFGLAVAPSGIDVTPWCTLVAKQRYGVDRIEATYTRRNVTLTNSSSTSYGPMDKGAVILAFSSGNRYILDEDAVTIPGTGAVTASFRSEFASDSAAGIGYTDPPDDTIDFVTASFPGVGATNPPPAFDATIQTGSGIGTVTPSVTAAQSNPDAHAVLVRIDFGGNTGTATWSTNLDGGGWVSHGTASSVTNLSSTHIDITLDNNSASPAFIAGTIFTIQSPGTDVTEVGRDIETPQELGARCRGLWPSLAFPQDEDGNWIPTSPTINAYEALARSANKQVKVCFVLTDGTINNKVLIYVAGQGALLPNAAIVNLKAFFDAYSMLTDLPVVTSPTLRAITLGAVTITVKAALKSAAQIALQKALLLYFGGGDINAPLTVNGLVDHAYIASLIRTTTGVLKFDDTAMTINGSAADLQLPVTPGAFELAAWTQQVASAFTWISG